MTLARNNICSGIVLAVSLSVMPGLRADVTIRYQSEVKPAAALQPLMEKFTKSLHTQGGTAVSVKGSKAYTKAGNLTEIFDLGTQQLTLIDPENKRYASLPAAQLADRMSAALPQAKPEQMQAAQQAMASMQTHIDSRVTGQPAEILGVQAEEREVTVTMEMPVPGTPTNLPDAGLKIVMHIWTAKKEEALRNPAIRELTGYQAWQRYFMNPTAMFEKMAGKMPGMSNTLAPAMEEMFKNPSVILRIHVAIYIPFLAAMAKRMPGHGGADAMDPDAPMLEMKQELAELSNAPVDAGLFEIPKDYASAPADELIREMVKAQGAGAAPAAKPEAK